MVKLALYKGRGNLANAAIRIWTGSKYSHCELVVDGWCYSSSVRDNGVRRKLIDLNSGNWDLLYLPWVSGDKVREYFDKTDYMSYGWSGLVTSQVFNLGLPGRRAMFCSEWCADAIGIPNPSAYNPQTLGEICPFISGIYGN